VDANGLGVGLVDYLVKENVDELTGEVVPPFSVINDEEGNYSQFKTDKSLPLLFNVKANASNTTQIHVNCLTQISSGKVKFLIDEMTAKMKFLNERRSRDKGDVPSEEVAKYIAPFITTSIMKDEMLNLQRTDEGKNVQLKRINKRIGKDKFSSLEYMLYYVKQLEDKNIVRRTVVDDFSKFMMIRSPKLDSGRW
jgi:hypothetical protein